MSKKLKLTIMEARELHQQLDSLFGKKETYILTAPIIIERGRWNPPFRPYWYVVLGVAVADWDLLINRNHNHAEEKDGLWIHRKGATHAEDGMMGVIPGNMRDGSFIVRGKGNPDSLFSSSHGAGRVMGRKQAKRELDADEFEETMQGITALVGESTLDESPMAYKDIFEVMRLQADLVDTIHHVTPIVNVKC